MLLRGMRTVAFILILAVATFGTALPAQALQFVLTGDDFSGPTNNTGGDITVTITDVTGGVQIEVVNNLVDPGAFLDALYLNTTFAPLTTPTASCVDCDDINVADGVDPGVSFGNNTFKADGDGLFDILFDPSNSEANRLIPGDSITFTILAADLGFDADSFNVGSCGKPLCAGGGNSTFLAAAHIGSLPPDGGGSDFLGTPIPEPMTVFLGGTGLLALGYAARKRLFGGRVENAI